MLNLTMKDNKTARHFELKVQKLVEKGWCNENASTINLICNEIFPKNLKDFDNKIQVKHTSTVLEPSNPFQDFTLQFKHQSTVQPNYTKFTSPVSKDYLLLLHI